LNARFISLPPYASWNAGSHGNNGLTVSIAKKTDFSQVTAIELRESKLDQQ
jgi:hypothetical protein